MMFNEIELSSVITDIAAGPFGSNLKVSCFVPYGFPIIDGANLKGFKVTDNLTKFVTEEKARSLSRSIARRGDVIITISGTLGQIAYIPDDSMFEEYLCSQRQFRVSFDTSRVYVPYLVFYFHTNEGQGKILSFANQTGVPALSQPLKNFRKIRIQLPSYKEQRRIASVIEAINDKIECNQKINDNLEQQAQSLFFEYFGRVSRNALPDGWSAATLGDVAVICNKSFNPAKEPETMLEHYSIPAFDETHFPVFELSTNIKSNKFKVDADCFMISKLNPSTKRVWKPYCLTGKAVCSTEFIVYKAKDQGYTDFLYSLIDSDDFSAFMCSHVTGSTGSRQRTPSSETLQYSFVMPAREDVALFSSLVHPMYEQIRVNAIENEKLKRLRDSLLPKLMSGTVDVSSIQL